MNSAIFDFQILDNMGIICRIESRVPLRSSVVHTAHHDGLGLVLILVTIPVEPERNIGDIALGSNVADVTPRYHRNRSGNLNWL